MGFILLSAEYEIYGLLYFLLTGFERYHGVDASLDFARRFSRMQDLKGRGIRAVTFLGSHVKKVRYLHTKYSSKVQSTLHGTA